MFLRVWTKISSITRQTSASITTYSEETLWSRGGTLHGGWTLLLHQNLFGRSKIEGKIRWQSVLEQPIMLAAIQFRGKMREAWRGHDPTALAYDSYDMRLGIWIDLSFPQFKIRPFNMRLASCFHQRSDQCQIPFALSCGFIAWQIMSINYFIRWLAHVLIHPCLVSLLSFMRLAFRLESVEYGWMDSTHSLPFTEGRWRGLITLQANRSLGRMMASISC